MADRSGIVPGNFLPSFKMTNKYRNGNNREREVVECFALNMQHSKSCSANSREFLSTTRKGSPFIFFMQEPYLYKGKIAGFNRVGECVCGDNPRAAIIASSNLNIWKVFEYTSRDMAAGLLKTQSQEFPEIYVASVYLDINDEHVIPENLDRFGYLGKITTVFQAEVHAITKACECIHTTDEHRIIIYSDSQAGILALNSPTVHSKTVFECMTLLNKLAEERDVTIRWVKAHVGHYGNEIADELAKQGTHEVQEGPEPFLPVSDSYHKDLIRRALESEWTKRWQSRKDCRQTKHWFPVVNSRKSVDIFQQSRVHLGWLIQFLTGHNFLRRHEALQNPTVNPTCRLCGEEEETSWHLATNCPACWRERSEIFNWIELRDNIPEWSTLQVNRFLRVPIIADLLDPED